MAGAGTGVVVVGGWDWSAQMEFVVDQLERDGNLECLQHHLEHHGPSVCPTPKVLSDTPTPMV